MHKQVTKSHLPQEVQEAFKLLPASTPKIKIRPGIRVEFHIDVADILNQIRFSIDHAGVDLTPSHARKINAQLDRWCTKQTIGDNLLVRFSDSTISAAGQILLLITRICLKPASGKPMFRKSGNFGQTTSFVRACLDTLVTFTKSAERALCWIYPIEYIRSACGFARIDFEEFLSGGTLGETFQAIHDGSLHALEIAVKEGRIEDAELIFSFMRSHKILKENAFDTLAKMLEKNAALLPFASQEWIMSSIDMRLGEPKLEYVSPSESPEIRQAAGLLLFLWDHAKENATAREALERFKELCKKHFLLFLRGDIGTVVPYDSRVHEATGPASENVKLLRPWVEWFNPPRASVVIRALVTSAVT